MKFFDGVVSFFNKLFPPSEKQYSKTYSSFPSQLQSDEEVMFDDTTSLERLDNFALFEEIDNDSPEGSLALDYYADMVTQGDDVLMRGHNVTVDVEGDDEKEKEDRAQYNVIFDAKKRLNPKETAKYKEQIKKIINDFEERTLIKYRLRDMVRDALKYGDNFEEIIWGKKGETVVIADFNPIPIRMMRLNRDDMNRIVPETPYWAVEEEKSILIKFPKSKIFRIQSGTVRDNVFGRSLFHSGRKTYLRLDAVESGMAVGRLVRSHQRYAHKVDVTGMSYDKGLEYTEKYKRMFTKKKITDANGNIKWIKAPLAADEDLFIPVKKDSPADLKVLEASAYLGNIEDVIYLRDKFVTSIKLTRPALGGTDGSKNATAELETNPIRFVKSLQNNVRFSLIYIYKLELIANGIPEEIVEEVEISMPEISSVAEYRKWTIEKLRAEICKIYKESGILSLEKILENIMYLESEEIAEIVGQLEAEAQKDMENQMTLMTKQAELAPKPVAGTAAKTPAKKSNYPAQRKTTVRVTNKNKQNGKGANALTQPQQTEGNEDGIDAVTEE